MNEYNFVNEIKNRYKVEELDSKTLEYRINSFIKACGINLENGIITKDISSNKLEYANIKCNEENYSINFYRTFSYELGSGFTLLGEYQDLELSFINYYKKDKNKKKINNLPFKISVDKKIDDCSYTLDITGNKNRVKFIISMNKAKSMLPSVISFYANVLDFGVILRLVNAFVTNPELVIDSYSEVIKKNSACFTNTDLYKGVSQDNSLDEPVEGIKKFVRTLFKQRGQ